MNSSKFLAHNFFFSHCTILYSVLVKGQHAEHVQTDLTNSLKRERSLVSDLKEALAKEKGRLTDLSAALEKERVQAMSLK